METEPKIFDIKVCGETEVIVAESLMAALKFYLEHVGYSKHEIESIDDIVEVPESDWDKRTVVYPDEERGENDEPLCENFRKAIENVTIPFYLSSTNY